MTLLQVFLDKAHEIFDDFFSIVDAPLKRGHYMDSEAMMKIRVDIAYPLVTPKQVAQKATISTEQV